MGSLEGPGGGGAAESAMAVQVECFGRSCSRERQLCLYLPAIASNAERNLW